MNYEWEIVRYGINTNFSIKVSIIPDSGEGFLQFLSGALLGQRKP